MLPLLSIILQSIQNPSKGYIFDFTKTELPLPLRFILNVYTIPIVIDKSIYKTKLPLFE